MNKFDVIVIGGGVAGLHSAKLTANAGLSTLLIEKDTLGGRSIHGGGTFFHHIYQSLKMVNNLQHAEYWNIQQNCDDAKIDFSALFTNYERRKKLIETRHYEEIQTENLVYVQGFATLVDPHTVQVNEEKYVGKHIILAYGAKLRRPDILGLENALQKGYIITPTQVESIKNKPKSLVVFGGGRIAIEIAEFFANVGTKVTLLSRGPLLKEADEDVRSIVLKNLKKNNLRIITGYENVTIEDQKVTYQFNGNTFSITPDFSVLAMGYMYNDTPLQSVSLNHNEDGVIVDDNCRSSIAHIFAIGDTNHRPKLSNLAVKEAEIAAKCIIGAPMNIENTSYMNGLMGIYEYAYIGLNETQIKESSEPYFSAKFSLSRTQRIFSYSDTPLIKLYYSKITHKLLGLHVYGENGNDELAQLYSLLNPSFLYTGITVPFHSRLQEIKEQVETLLRQQNQQLINTSMRCAYQPIVDQKTQALLGYESLSRFYIDDVYQMPLPIIQMLETTGFIKELDLKSLTEAGKTLAVLKEKGELDRPLNISINISKYTLLNVAPQQIVQRILKAGFSPSQITIEVTERQALDEQRIFNILSTLKESGFRISLDDFSMGHASMSIVARFPFDEIKIDRDLLPQSEGDLMAIRSYEHIVNLLNSYGVEIVAEGIENEYQVRFVSKLKINRLQGYYFSKPIFIA